MLNNDSKLRNDKVDVQISHCCDSGKASRRSLRIATFISNLVFANVLGKYDHCLKQTLAFRRQLSTCIAEPE